MADSYPTFDIKTRDYFSVAQKAGHHVYYNNNEVNQIFIDGVKVYEAYEYVPVTWTYPDPDDYYASSSYSVFIRYSYTTRGGQSGSGSSTVSVRLTFDSSHNCIECKLDGTTFTVNSTTWTTSSYGITSFTISTSGRKTMYESGSVKVELAVWEITGSFDYNSTTRQARLYGVDFSGYAVYDYGFSSFSYNKTQSATCPGQKTYPGPKTEPTSDIINSISSYFNTNITDFDIKTLYSVDIRESIYPQTDWMPLSNAASYLHSVTDPVTGNGAVLKLDGSPTGQPIALTVNYSNEDVEYSFYDNSGGARHTHTIDFDFYIPYIPTWDSSQTNPNNNGIWIRCWVYSSASDNNSYAWAGDKGTANSTKDGRSYSNITTGIWNHLSFSTNGVGPHWSSEWDNSSSAYTFWIQRIRIAIWSWNGQSVPVYIKNLRINESLAN